MRTKKKSIQNKVKNVKNKNKNKIALLFLTKMEIIHRQTWKEKGYDNANIYIHPKIPGQNEDWNIWEIINNIDTEWGNCNIVEATLLLLFGALSNKNTEWFILCSDDTYPLKTYEELNNYLNKQNKSQIKVINKKERKTSQWFMLKRIDVINLLFSQNLNKVLIKLQKEKKACDEFFLLNVLPKLIYKNNNGYYIKWIEDIINISNIAKHPTIFNRLLPTDNIDNSFFIRKTTASFSPIKIIPSGEAYLIIHGTNSPNRLYTTNLPIFFLNLVDNMPLFIPNTCIQIYSCIWSYSNLVKKKLMKYLIDIGFNSIILIDETETI